MVCEIIVSHMHAVRIDVYIKYKISLLRDWKVISVYECLDDFNVELDSSAKSGVVEIHICKDPLKLI